MAERTLHEAAFPVLEEKDMQAIAKIAKLRRFEDGQKLFSAGDRDFKFFVIKSGEVEIIDVTGDTPKRIAWHTPRQFTGEINHLTGNPAIVSAISRGGGEAYEICDADLQHILQDNVRLSGLILQAFIARRQLLEQSGEIVGLRVIGSRFSADTMRIREFLDRNRVLNNFFDLEADVRVSALLARFGVDPDETPIVTCSDLMVLRNPSNRQMAETLGLRRPLEKKIYDLVIVGGGPSGLAASVYAASEGLSTLILESDVAGGQAGSSMKIENYLGFPTGISGRELIQNAVLQAHKFGVSISSPAPVSAIEPEGNHHSVRMDGESVTAKCVLIATGAEYRRLEAEGREKFDGRGVFYAATQTEVSTCRNATALVVGGGNSAGQAIVYLATQARQVYVLLRGGDLFKNMSHYLGRRIEQTENVQVLKNSQIIRMLGDNHLEAVDVRDKLTGEVRHIQTSAVFTFIGATPRTGWIPGLIKRDANGFIITGQALVKAGDWQLKRPPAMLETSCPGVFAAGDVRHDSIKRCASAIGEGAMAVQFIHEHLATL